MRRAFITELVAKAEKDSAITLVTGDLGYNVVEPFRDAFPAQFLNAGVAEQAMASLSAGMASVGKKVFLYSIVNFATFRCLEQIRNDIAYHNFDVCVVAVGAGTAYGTLGYSHHGLEDMAVMRAIPNMSIYSPADSREVAACLDEILQRGGPSYLRLGHEPSTAVHHVAPDMSGGLVTVRSGDEVTVLATGNLVHDALRAADALASRGIDAGIVSVPRVWPLDYPTVEAAAGKRPLVIVEDHSLRGGLSSAILEVLADHGDRRPVHRLGYPGDGLGTCGSQSFLREAFGLNTAGIAAAAASLVGHVDS